MRAMITAGTIVVALSIASFDAEARRPQHANKTVACKHKTVQHSSRASYWAPSAPAKAKWAAKRARNAQRARRAAAQRAFVRQPHRRVVVKSPYGYGRKVVQAKRRPVRRSVKSTRYVVSTAKPRVVLPAPLRIVLAVR